MTRSGATELASRHPSQDGNGLRAQLAGRARQVLGWFGLGGDTLLVIIKCVLAAGISWYLANNLLQMSSPTFAPFSAVLLVHSTVAQSVAHAGRYVLAMIGGVALAGVLSPLLGPGVATFAALVLLALFIGRWQRLGSQGPQVAVAAMFAYQSMVMVPPGAPASWSSASSAGSSCSAPQSGWPPTSSSFHHCDTGGARAACVHWRNASAANSPTSPAKWAMQA